MARPSDFTQEMADHICERLSEGESLRSICNDMDFPGKTTVFRWLSTNKEFRDQYARARECQADAIADEILNIADEAEDAGKARVQIDARKWLAGKLRPKVYGDKLAVGGDPDGEPINVVARIERVITK
jgi:methionine synthase II (cobalamin-independent)